MTRLAQIGVTVVVGFIVLSVAILFFGIAVKLRSTHIAPRCEARPRNVVYNPNPADPSQDRGNAWLGWIPWVLKLSYEDMLTGVPGTGTRDGGLGGNLLRVNMDNIVMLRFHSYGLRICTVALLLYIAVLLPLYWTAGCEGDEIGSLGAICKNMTDYDRTTLSNIIVDVTAAAGVKYVGFKGRLYVVVFCSWLMTAYACNELKQEWIDILAMRRHYFLESDHWKDCHDRYQSIEQEIQHDSTLQPVSFKTAARRKYSLWKKKRATEPDYLRERDPWVPHPEMKDTPPAIALYSVLVGGIPSKPVIQMDDEDHVSDIESAEDADSNRDWQLNVTSAFFDHCIPNQPGFSSSVAAVTIVPHAAELARSWKQWHNAAGRLRRLRFIRRQIREKRKMGTKNGQVEEGTFELDGIETADNILEPSFTRLNSIEDSTHSSTQTGKPSSFNYNREVLGSALDEDVEDLFLEAMEFGPEQTAVYSREFAQSAASCCPNGLFERKLVNASIEELLDLEEEAMEEVQAANKALEKARLLALTSDQSKSVNLATPQKKTKGEVKPSKSSVKKDSSHGRSHRKIMLGAGELPIDFKAVKNLMGNETMKNLMGRESVPSSDKKAAHKRSKTSSMGKIELPNDFDLEVQLWRHNNLKQSSAAQGAQGAQAPSPSGRARFFSEGMPQSSSDPWSSAATPLVSTNLSRLKKPENSRASSDPDWMDKQRVAGAAKVLPVGSSIAPLVLHSVKQQKAFDDYSCIPQVELHPLKQLRPQLSEPVINADDSCQLRTRHHRRPHTLSTSENLDLQLPNSDAPINRRNLLRKDQGAYRLSSTFGLADLGVGDPQETMLSTGNWELSSITGIFQMLLNGIWKLLRWTTKQKDAAVDLVAAQGTFAVVTFTSRQAAVAARQVLADGRGSDRFNQIATPPIPPLADAAPGDLLNCRGCCRPVTMSINDRQKKWRNIVALLALGNIYFFYTIPLTSAAAYANSENLSSLFPGLRDFKSSVFTADLLSALVGALIWAAFFAVCPIMFNTISNFGSNATSILEAEFWAMKAFWWFMVVSAFSGTSLQTILLEGFDEGIQVGNEIEDVLSQIAKTIPSQVSATWINWIIVKTFITGPLMYLLQLNTFVFDWAKLKCCVRAARGGGTGAPLPFRIYIDSGMVLLCLHALAPASPLVAVFAFLYFLFSTPMLRRNVIFMYKPKFNGGGIRWPFLFDMSISSIFVGQILLATMMALKESLVPALLAALPFLPTYLFRDAMRAKYLRAFNDVGLLQTSLLDGWDINDPESAATREARRMFLVDAHKAAYVPVCIAGTTSNAQLTAQPALVVPTIVETEMELLDLGPIEFGGDGYDDLDLQKAPSSTTQYGATLRRTPTINAPTSAQNGFNETHNKHT